MIRVSLPAHLRTLAKLDGEAVLDVEGPATQRAVLDALEGRYPVLRGTIRDHVTQVRRPFVRFFACEEDLSHEPPDAALPDAVATGAEPFIVIGAMAGGSMQGGSGPPFQNPPSVWDVGGTFGASFGATWGVGGTGKTDSHAGRRPCLRSDRLSFSIAGGVGSEP